MNAPRRAEGTFSLVRLSPEKAGHANDAEFPKLTGRELEILRLSATGVCSQSIADALFVSKRTVDFHFANIYRKWDVHNRIRAVNLAKQRGLLSA